MSLLHWLMPWRRAPRPDKPYRAAHGEKVVASADALKAAAQRTVQASVDAIQRQQESGLRERLIARSEELRTLTTETLDRLQ